MSLLLVLIAAPTLFALTVWVVVTALRILRPDDPIDVRIESVRVIARRTVGAAVAVGPGGADQRGSRDAWREFHHADYAWGVSDGVPEAWWENVLARRN